MNIKLLLGLLLSLLLRATSVNAQVLIEPDFSLSSAEIYHELEKLKVVGSVLYVAAHPDDENTRFLAYSANHLGMRSAYLSLTRGDGGQNLVGKEVSTSLGVIRTQELLAARKLDKAEQYFSRAVDFSYSKHPDETFSIWDREKILADAVWVIRKFRPDVIITRFSPDRAGRTHGHHTASAIIALEAFKLAGDKSAFPEQLELLDTWQASRILWNTSWWFYRGQEFDDSGLIKIDVSPFNARLGKSIGEIASASRSMHKSQGFGSSLQREETIEYFQPLEGDNGELENLFSFDHSFSRLNGGLEALAKQIEQIQENFDISDPSGSLKALVQLRKQFVKIEDQTWRERKLKDLDRIILACAGIWGDATTTSEMFSRGDSLIAKCRLIARSHSDTRLLSNSLLVNGRRIASFDEDESNSGINANKYTQQTFREVLPDDAEYTSPYWLKNKGSFGMFNIPDQSLIGLPELAPGILVESRLELAGEEISFLMPVRMRKTDPVDGEAYSPIAIVPEATVSFKESVVLSTLGEENQQIVEVSAHQDNCHGTISFEVPDGWLIEPTSFEYGIDKKGASQSFNLKIRSPQKSQSAAIKAKLEKNKEAHSYSMEVITHEHLPKQIVLRDASCKLVALDLPALKGKVGYIMGAGDAVPEGLRRIGYEVELLEEEDVLSRDLSSFKAILCGIRAFNTIDRIGFYLPSINDYIEEGGTFVIQYNTAHRLKSESFGPYNVQLSRDRVTVEEAEVAFLEKKHAILNQPNKITEKDFDDWVHERGLYFPSAWDEQMIPILEMNDPGEDSKQGSLLVGDYGKGAFIYTGLSFFRELPAGVPGAYRLLVNLIEYKPESSK